MPYNRQAGAPTQETNSPLSQLLQLVQLNNLVQGPALEQQRLWQQQQQSDASLALQQKQLDSTIQNEKSKVALSTESNNTDAFLKTLGVLASKSNMSLDTLLAAAPEVVRNAITPVVNRQRQGEAARVVNQNLAPLYDKLNSGALSQYQFNKQFTTANELITPELQPFVDYLELAQRVKQKPQTAVNSMVATMPMWEMAQ